MPSHDQFLEHVVSTVISRCSDHMTAADWNAVRNKVEALLQASKLRGAIESYTDPGAAAQILFDAAADGIAPEDFDRAILESGLLAGALRPKKTIGKPMLRIV